MPTIIFKKVFLLSLVVSWLIFIIAFSAVIYNWPVAPDSAVKQATLAMAATTTFVQRPLPCQSNDNLARREADFTFSPDSKYIAFVRDVFEEYGGDWDKYWAIKLLDVQTNQEKTIFVDDGKLSGYRWLTNDIIRVIHGGGTGVHMYRDITINQTKPLFYKDYKYLDNAKFWKMDEEYARTARAAQLAEAEYLRLKGEAR